MPKYEKPALTFEQQLEQLKKRGLIIRNFDLAISQLSTVSYYRLSAYWYPYLRRDLQGNVLNQFEVNVTFDDVINLYEFDRRLRLIIMDAIERVEVHIRTILTYHLGCKYGAFAHIEVNNFHPKFHHKEWIENLEKEAKRSQEAFIVHYREKYSDFPTLPIWMLTEIISFGSLSKFYTGLLSEDKKLISEKFNIHYKCLQDWLHTLTYIRNICAHHSRLWNRELAIRPHQSNLAVWRPPVTPRNDRIFYILLILRFLLKETSNKNDFTQQCMVLLDNAILKNKWQIAMGIPSHWKEHPLFTA